MFDHPEKMQNTEVLPYDAFYSALRSFNPLEAENTEYVNLFRSGLTTEQDVVKLKLSKPPLCGIEKYEYLQQKRKQEQMNAFRAFLLWYNNKKGCAIFWASAKNDLVLPRQRCRFVEAWLYITKLDQHLRTQVYRCKILSLHGSRQRPIREKSKRCCWWTIYRFLRKLVVEETFFRKSTNLCKSIVGVDSSQLYPYSVCQPMSTGLYTRWEFDSETCRFTPRQNKTHSFDNMLISYFQRIRADCKTGSFYKTSRQNKIDCSSVDAFCLVCNTVFESMGCFYHFCPCQEVRPTLSEEGIQHNSKKRKPDALRGHYIEEKGLNDIEMWECERWRLHQITNTVKQSSLEHFP